MKVSAICEPTKWDGLIVKVTGNANDAEFVTLPPDMTMRFFVCTAGSFNLEGGVADDLPLRLVGSYIAGNCEMLPLYPLLKLNATANGSECFVIAVRPYRLTLEHGLRKHLQGYEQIEGVAVGATKIKVKVAAEWVSTFQKPTPTSASAYAAIEKFRALLYTLYGVVPAIEVNDILGVDDGLETDLTVNITVPTLTEPTTPDDLFNLARELREVAIKVLRWAFTVDEATGSD